MKPTFIISAESTLADVRALMDSYAVEVLKDSLVIFRGPLHACKMDAAGVGQFEFDPPPTHGRRTNPVVSFDLAIPVADRSLELRLIQYEPPTDNDFLEGIRERATRWPFYVHAPLVICLSIDEQWWQWAFTPGKNYEMRNIPR
jgi:hypothetical protein